MDSFDSMDIPVKKTLYDWIIEGLAILCLLGVCYPLFFYGELAGISIPIHYNAAGQTDGWGNRSFLFSLPVAAIVFYAGMSIGERFYTRFNFPVKLTEENADALYKLGVRLMRFLKFWIILIFAYLNISSYTAATAKGIGMSGMVMAALLAVMFIALFFFMMKMARCRP